MRPFSFVHAADLHLGSPFAGVTARASDLARDLAGATLAAFRNLVEFVLESGADFLLIAGDVFDGDHPSLKARLDFADGMRILCEAKVPVFVAYGNHDPLAAGLGGVKLPENVTVFGSLEAGSAQASDREGAPVAEVLGVSFAARDEARNLVLLLRPARGGVFSIGLVHANAGGRPGHENYAPCSLADIQQSGVCYMALGHVHERAVVCRQPLAAYPGNLQGRSFRETGPRGAFFVRVDAAGSPVETFVPLDAVRFSEKDIDIAPFSGLEELAPALEDAVREMAEDAEGRGLICRLRLSGRGPLHAELSASGARADLLGRLRERLSSPSPLLWPEDLIIRTLPEADLSERREGKDLFAQVLAIADEWRESPAERTREALKTLLEDARMRTVLSPLSEDETAELVDRAVLSCLDILEGGRR